MYKLHNVPTISKLSTCRKICITEDVSPENLHHRRGIEQQMSASVRRTTWTGKDCQYFLVSSVSLCLVSVLGKTKQNHISAPTPPPPACDFCWFVLQVQGLLCGPVARDPTPDTQTIFPLLYNCYHVITRKSFKIGVHLLPGKIGTAPDTNPRSANCLHRWGILPYHLRFCSSVHNKTIGKKQCGDDCWKNYHGRRRLSKKQSWRMLGRFCMVGGFFHFCSERTVTCTWIRHTRS